MEYDKDLILKCAGFVMGACSTLVLDKQSYMHKRMASDFSLDEMHKIASWMAVFQSWLGPEGEKEFIERMTIDGDDTSLEPFIVVSKEEPELALSDEDKIISVQLSSKIDDVYMQVGKRFATKTLWYRLQGLNYKIMADICQNKRNDFLRLQGFGRKSMSELDLLIKKTGLKYDIDPKRYNVTPTCKKIFECQTREGVGYSNNLDEP